MIEIEDKGYFKMHWELWPLCNDDCKIVMLVEYIYNVYNILKESKVIDGVEYKKLTDSFIQERINYSSPTIRKYLEVLEENGLINTVKVSNGLKGVRYVHLNIHYFIENDNETVNESINERPIESPIEKSFNKINKYNNKLNNYNIYNKEKTAEAANVKETDSLNSKSFKNVMSYINSLSYSKDTNEALIKWYNNIGKGRVSIKQLQDKLKKICEATNNDEALIKEAIENAYLNGWFGFFKSKYNNSTFKHVDNIKKENKISNEEIEKMQFRVY